MTRFFYNEEELTEKHDFDGVDYKPVNYTVLKNPTERSVDELYGVSELSKLYEKLAKAEKALQDAQEVAGIRQGKLAASKITRRQAKAKPGPYNNNHHTTVELAANGRIFKTARQRTDKIKTHIFALKEAIAEVEQLNELALPWTYQIYNPFS